MTEATIGQLVGLALRILTLGASVITAIAIISWGVIALPAEVCAKLGIATFRSEHLAAISITALTTSALTFVNLCCYLWVRTGKFFKARTQEIKDNESKLVPLLRRLKGLAPAEKGLLREAVAQHCQTITAPMGDPTAQALVAKGILRQSQGIGYITEWTFTIDDFVFDVLMEAPEVLS